MIRSRDDDDVRFFFCEKLFVMLVGLRSVTGKIRHLVRGNFEPITIDVAQAHELAPARGGRFFQNILAPPTATDECRTKFFIFALSEDVWGGAEQGGGRSSLLEKGASVHK